MGGLYGFNLMAMSMALSSVHRMLWKPSRLLEFLGVVVETVI